MVGRGSCVGAPTSGCSSLRPLLSRGSRRTTASPFQWSIPLPGFCGGQLSLSGSPQRLSPLRGLPSCVPAVSGVLGSPLQSEKVVLPWRCSVAVVQIRGRRLEVLSLLCVRPDRLYKVWELLLFADFSTRGPTASLRLADSRVTSWFWAGVSPSTKSGVRIKVFWDSGMERTLAVRSVLRAVNIRNGGAASKAQALWN